MSERKVSKYLMNRRFRRRIRSKMKQKLRRKRMQCVKYNYTYYYRQIRRKVHSFYDALNACMPNHFKYLITAEQSPFLQKRLEKVNFTHELRLTVPNEFSILSNPSVSYGFLKKLISIILYQSCEHLKLDYSNCKICDLATQVFMDSILIDNHEFIKQCQRANLTKYLKIKSIGGYGINEHKLQLMINSVGSPVELLNRRIKFNNIIPFKLRHIDGNCVTKRIQSGQKEIDTTDLIQYVIDCLRRFNMNLSQQARQDLGNVIGEIISNAEEHSSLHNRYLIGYMEESSINDMHHGILNLVMMNSGCTIYEKFKYPDPKKQFNRECLGQMQCLSDKFRKKSFFHPNAFTEENLWTLYSLQGGVSSIPPSVRKRGNGTIEFIDSFFKLKGTEGADNISKMSIISGNTQIDFDGTYRIAKIKNEAGEIVSRMTFNTSNSLEDKPDPKYVFHVDTYFPGTIIYAQLLIHNSNLQ